MADKQRILEDVPRVGFERRADGTYHFCPLPACVHAAMAYLKDPVDYGMLMCVSGAAFRSVWHKDEGGNVDLMDLSPTPHERLFDALGYDYALVDGRDEQAMRASIVRSLDEGRPVIAFGIMGPPEAGLVTGYERGGQVLRGWSYFDHDPPGAYYRRENWFAQIQTKVPIGAIIIGRKRPARPSQRATAVAALGWAIDLFGAPQRPGLPNHVFGAAAYDAWAKALAIDANFPADDAKVMARRRMLYDDQLMMLSEREYAASWLRDLAAAFPEAADPLSSAARLYRQAADHAGPMSGPRKRIHEAAVRQDAIAHIRAVRDAEVGAIEQLQRALPILRKPPARARE